MNKIFKWEKHNLSQRIWYWIFLEVLNTFIKQFIREFALICNMNVSNDHKS